MCFNLKLRGERGCLSCSSCLVHQRALWRNIGSEAIRIWSRVHLHSLFWTKTLGGHDFISRKFPSINLFSIFFFFLFTQ